MEVSVGIKVAARGLEWNVTEVEQLGAQQRLRLSCCSGDLTGLDWDVLYPAEAVTVLRSEPRAQDAGPLSDWQRYHIAWLLDQIPGAPLPPGRVAIEAYQRVPLLRALDMVRPRLLLADGVGLGKTIQAGLIAAELLVRRRAHRILVVCPPGPLLQQWEQEMRIRFGLRFTAITDNSDLRDLRRGRELGDNPFDTTALCLTSLDFAKQDRVLAELERTAWDLVIIDEAHHCVGGTGENSQRRRLAEVLARRGDGLLLLTATPHDGHDLHFASLMTLLDPSLVDGAGRLIGSGYRRHMVRRLKSHIRDPRTGLSLFRERVVVPVRVDVSAAEAAPVRTFHRALSALVGPRLRRAGRGTGLADALAFVSLLKRSMSSIAACLATLHVVAARYAEAQPARAVQRDRAAWRRQRRRTLQAYRRQAARFGVLDTADEAAIAALEAEDIADTLDGTEAVAQLRALIRLGEAAAPLDPKLAALVLEIRLIRLAHPAANVLVYTEYTDSQRAAVAALQAAGLDGTVLTISGADAEVDRTRAAERCAEADGIILVSTDSLAEGLNLHQRCCHLIHLDLPYNPNRLEQRNGRIDRYGQRQDPQIRYLYLAGTFEERLLLRLIAKYETARACLSFMPDTLGVTADAGRLHEPLLAGFAEDAPSLFSDMPRLVHSLDLAAEDSGSDGYRDLLREIDRAFASFDHMAVRHGWMSAVDTPDRSSDPAPVNPAATSLSANPIDLTAFIASTLVPDTHGLRVPAGWVRELDQLAGFDRLHGTVRLTHDASQLHDADGRALMYPGRAHPLTRRAIGWARTSDTGRVSVVQGHACSLLMTYVAEIGGPHGVVFCQVFALRLFPDGVIEPQSDFLSLGTPEPTLSNVLPIDGQRADRLWRTRFGSWGMTQIAAAEPVAHAAANLLAASFAAAHRQRLDNDIAVAQVWLQRRSAELCGAVLPSIGDLFDGGPPIAAWRTCAVAEERLSGFAHDAGVPVPHRRDAADILSRFRAIIQQPHALPPPSVRTLGMLMLCP